MSVSYYSNLIVGIRLADLEPETIVKTEYVTRYNEENGEPYEKQIDKIYTKIGKMQLPGTLIESLKYFDEDARPSQQHSLGESNIPQLFSTEYIDFNRDQKYLPKEIFLGYLVCQVTHEDIKFINVGEIVNTEAQFNQWLEEKLGVTVLRAHTYLMMDHA